MNHRVVFGSSCYQCSTVMDHRVVFGSSCCPCSTVMDHRAVVGSSCSHSNTVMDHRMVFESSCCPCNTVMDHRVMVWVGQGWVSVGEVWVVGSSILPRSLYICNTTDQDYRVPGWVELGPGWVELGPGWVGWVVSDNRTRVVLRSQSVGYRSDSDHNRVVLHNRNRVVLRSQSVRYSSDTDHRYYRRDQVENNILPWILWIQYPS